jgi:hypothetical protein
MASLNKETRRDGRRRDEDYSSPTASPEAVAPLALTRWVRCGELHGRASNGWNDGSVLPDDEGPEVDDRSA